MKTIFTLFATLFLFVSVDAKIVYLNNNLEAPIISENLYINWADAYAAASAGDTIYVVGSNVDHGRVNISKRLTIIGPGYLLDENNHTQVDKKTANFLSMTFEEGSKDSHVEGITFTQYNLGIEILDNLDNLVFTNCYVPKFTILNSNGFVNEYITIKKCFIWGGSSIYTYYNRNGIFSNFVMTNNIVVGDVRMPEGSTGIISNNLFMNEQLLLGNTSSFEFSNNIFLNQKVDKFTIQPLPNASVHHNISLTGAFGNDNNNLTAPQSTLFNTDENATSDAKYQLSANSPAKGAGSNDTDIGPFGGPDPYRLSGLPNLPNIYELSTSGLVSGDKLPVHIKIKQ
jgi:hypothetical protein